MVNDESRKAEQAKYPKCYAHGPRKYEMGGPRIVEVATNLSVLPCRGSLLDVGCGREEILKIAAAIGFDPCGGTEIVPALLDGDRIVFAECHALPFPDNSFDVVTLLDVLEHLLPGDDEAACHEIERVGKRFLLLTVSSGRSNFAGHKLHINRRPCKKWYELFREWFAGEVTLLNTKGTDSTWKVELQQCE